MTVGDTILFLGGAASQIVAMREAREMGFRVACCDFDPYCAGSSFADCFYNVSTVDEEKLERVAKQVRAQGIVAYATDRAAPTAARVAARLSLPGNLPKAVESFCRKDQFRAFLENGGFCVPRSRCFHNIADMDSLDLPYPLVVKPTDSAGSRGVSVVHNELELPRAAEEAFCNSRSGTIIVEEFVRSANGYGIEAEIFVINGVVTTWGLLESMRDANTNPLVPAGYRYPLRLPHKDISTIKEEISRLVGASGIKNGAFNIEMVLDDRGKVFFLDVGPRSGGNRLPEFIRQISGVDMIRATIECSVGHFPDASELLFNGEGEGGFWSLVVLHSSEEGVFSHVEYSNAIRTFLVDEFVTANQGDQVGRFRTGDDVLGLVTFCFPTQAVADHLMDDINSHVQVVIQRGNERQ